MTQNCYVCYNIYIWQQAAIFRNINKATRFIYMFLKTSCCQNADIVLHLASFRYIYIYIYIHKYVVCIATAVLAINCGQQLIQLTFDGRQLVFFQKMNLRLRLSTVDHLFAHKNTGRHTYQYAPGYIHTHALSHVNN